LATLTAHNELELYDTLEDPDEMHNLAHESGYSDPRFD
jgi:hypothetical protein